MSRKIWHTCKRPPPKADITGTCGLRYSSTKAFASRGRKSSSLENQTSLLVPGWPVRGFERWQSLGIQVRLSYCDSFCCHRACTPRDCRSKELNVPNPCPIAAEESPTSASAAAPYDCFEFRPEPADAFGAGARHPAKTSAEELVFFFTFQAEAEGFFVEAGEVSRRLRIRSASPSARAEPWRPGTRARWSLAMASQRMSRLGSKDQ